MTTSSEVIKIARQLVSRTRAGALRWDFDGETDDTFSASSDRFLYIVSTRDNDGEPPFKLQVWKFNELADGTNKNVKLLDVDTIGAFSTSNQAVSALLDAARLSSAGLTGSLAEEVLGDLGGEPDMSEGEGDPF